MRIQPAPSRLRQPSQPSQCLALPSQHACCLLDKCHTQQRDLPAAACLKVYLCRHPDDHPRPPVYAAAVLQLPAPHQGIHSNEAGWAGGQGEARAAINVDVHQGPAARQQRMHTCRTDTHRQQTDHKHNTQHKSFSKGSRVQGAELRCACLAGWHSSPRESTPLLPCMLKVSCGEKGQNN